MKKRILIVSDSLNMGGLEKCLINFCDNLDYSVYDVDLYLFNEGRTLLYKLNKNVNLLPDSPYYKDVYNTPFFKSIKALLKKGKFSFAWYRLIRFLRIRLKDYKYRNIDWEIMQKTMLNLKTKYDIAIGFAEGTACYYVAHCVDADKKIGCIHTDLKKVSRNEYLDQNSFEKLDHVLTVSKNSLKSLIELYPKCKDKYICIHLPLLMDYDKMLARSLEKNCMDDETEAIKVLSVGRLVELKGFHLCVEPCKRLIDEGLNIKWYIAGEGDYRPTLEKLIKQYGLEDRFILLGNCTNPYSCIRSADICVQPSSYEGFSLSVIEGKYLKKAMVVTNIPSYLEMISNNENGLVVNRDSEEIFTAVKKLILDKNLRETLAAAPALVEIDSKKIIKQFEKLFII